MKKDKADVASRGWLESLKNPKSPSLCQGMQESTTMNNFTSTQIGYFKIKPTMLFVHYCPTRPYLSSVSPEVGMQVTDKINLAALSVTTREGILADDQG